MNVLAILAVFFGGVFCINAVPHIVSAVMGRPFPTPFAKPPGKGLSSTIVNVIWGFVNLCVSYLLTCVAGRFDPKSLGDTGILALGAFLGALLLARTFGRLHGGDLRP